MNHRHLLPNEIDLLVDGEAGFGVAPLRAHVLECDECRERVDDARIVVEALEALPHFAPDSRLSDRVMAQVPVFVPAHVAARDSVRRWMPQSSAARVAAVAIGTSVAGVLTLAMAWLVTVQGDAVVFMAGLLGDRFRSVVAAAARDVAVALLGESALSALQASGALGTSLLLAGFLLAAVGTVVGLRRLAVAGRRA
jgi:anti-sigma factor RsiW